jgi:predicted nucleic acid-binding Zn ribbon protein
MTEGSHCSVCGTVIKAQTTVAATGHKAVTDAAVAATCTMAGKTEGSHCSVCGTVIKAQSTIETLAHTIVEDAGYAATYTKTGLSDGSHCSVCGQVLTEQTELEKLALPYKDVQDQAWYANAVRLMYERGIMSGTTETTFCPGDKLTRAQLVVMLWNFEGRPYTAYTKVFSDVPSGKYYTTAVEWAKKSGVVNGSNGKFKPGDPITRQDFAVILKNYAAYKLLDTEVNTPNAYTKCTDYTKVSSYAKLAIGWAYERNLIGSNGTLAPKDNITRAEAASMLQRFLLFFEL